MGRTVYELFELDDFIESYSDATIYDQEMDAYLNKYSYKQTADDIVDQLIACMPETIQTDTCFLVPTSLYPEGTEYHTLPQP